MKYLTLFLMLCFSARAAETHWFDTAPRTFKELVGDPRESQLRLGYMRTDERHNYMDFSIGGHIGLLRSKGEETEISIVPRGHVSSRFQMGSKSFDLQATDYFGGLAFAWKRGIHSYEVLLQHTSSHLGDGVEGREAFNFSQESLRVLYGLEAFPTWRFYTGTEVIIRSDPQILRFKPILIGGAEWRVLGADEPLFAILDVRLKGTHDYSPSTALTVGYDLGASSIIRRQRLFTQIFYGHSNSGQFYLEREFYFLAGIGFNM